MEISFSLGKLQKNCSSEKESTKAWGHDKARKLRQRLSELQAANSLAEIYMLPGARCHQLKGKRAEQFAVDVTQPFRLIFVPHHNPMPCKDDGSIDPTKVTKIRILEVSDYHGE